MKTNKYMKRIVIFCIAFIVVFTIVSMWLNYSVAMELSPTLTTCVYAFFGTELAATCAIKIADNLKEKEEEKDKPEI